MTIPPTCRKATAAWLRSAPTLCIPAWVAFGGTAYEAICNCNFAHNYKLAFSPRLGLAYQINPKTVLRAGVGIVYTGTPQYNLAGPALSAQNNFGPNADPG